MSIFRGLDSLWCGTKNVDDTILEISEAAKNAKTADKSNDNSGFFHSALEMVKRSVDGTNYVTTAIQKGCIHVPIIFATTIDPAATHFLQGSSMTGIMGGIGLLGSTLGLITNTIAFDMQEKTLEALAHLTATHDNKTDPQALRQVLANLRQINYHPILLTLPDYLKKRLETKKNGVSIFDNMMKDLNFNDTKVLHEIETGAMKKAVYHKLCQITSAFGIFASFALLLGCPMVGLIVLTIISIALAVAGILLKNGWVENQEAGFNWKLCLPEALQKKLNVDRDIETPTLNADTFTAKQIHDPMVPTEKSKSSSAQTTPAPSSSTTGIDPITQLEFTPEDKLIVVENTRFNTNTQFNAETLASYLITNTNDNCLWTANLGQLTLWRNSTEYRNLLQSLQPLIKNPVSIKEIQMRIAGYPLARTLIQEFDQAHPNFSFRNLLEFLYQNMRATDMYGTKTSEQQKTLAFDAYYKLRSCLPETVLKIIFPIYAYNPGDPTCISSVSRVLQGQIERLALLGLVPRSTIFSRKALGYQIDPYIQWFEKKYASPVEQSTHTQTHWAGTIASEKAEHEVVDRDLSIMLPVTLRYITLDQGADAYDGFALALVDKFRENKIPLLNTQDPISKLLTSNISENTKRAAIKLHLQQLIKKQSPRQVLQQICEQDRNVFRSMRSVVQGKAQDTLKDDEVWTKIEQDPDLLHSFLQKNVGVYLQRFIQETLNLEIPASSCDYDGKGSLRLNGAGAYPHVMRDLRDNSFKLLLSAN